MANQILLMYYQHHYLFELIQQQFSSYCSIDVGVQSSEYSRAAATVSHSLPHSLVSFDQLLGHWSAEMILSAAQASPVINIQ